MIALLGAAPTDRIELKRVAKVGDTTTWTLYVNTFIQELLDGLSLAMEGEIKEEVLEVLDDGSLKFKMSQTITVIKTDGQDIELPADSKVSTQIVATSGRVTALSTVNEDSNAYRTSDLTSIMWPQETVDVGSTWEVKTKGDEERNTVDVSRSYRVLSREFMFGRDCLKISFVHQETAEKPATFKGTCWIDVTNGIIVKMDGVGLGVPMGGMVTDTGYRLELKTEKS